MKVDRSAFAALAGALLSCAMIATGIMAMRGAVFSVAVPWSLPLLGEPHFTLNAFGGFFTLIAGVVALPTSIYSAAYLRRYEGHYSVAWFAVGYLVLLLAIVGIFAAADVVSFIVAWEVMTLASCGLVAFEWRERTKVRAAVLMLTMSEFGTLATVLAFLLASPAGDMTFAAIARHAPSLSPILRTFVVLLSFFGFGVKAGILPFNAWLPRAYPAAPSNVTSIVAGALVNCGLYGMLLVNLVLVPQGALLFGIVALIVGVLSAFIGILYATIDDDLKRMLAFSSIENIGIVVAAFGAGAIFFGMGRLDLAALGFGAGLWHMANHACYKSLLFLGAGAVDVRTGTRRMNLLGGLARAMPVTAVCFLVGALAIAAIPPLNGFASEWLTLETLLRSAEIGPLAFKIGFVLAGALLALTAALAVTCFVKAYAMTFLGASRSDAARTLQGELSAAAGVGMVLLALVCIIAGLLPAQVVQLVDAALPGALHGQLVQALVPPFLVAGGSGLPLGFLHDFQALGATLGAGIVPARGLVLLHRGGSANPVVFAMSTTYIVTLAAIMLAALVLFVRAATRRRARKAPVWSGGLRPLLPEMTYTATGFSNPVRVIFEAVFNPRTVEHSRHAVHEHFRIAITRERDDAFGADRLVIEPLIAKVRSYANDLARMHHGRLEGYVLYAVGALVVVMFVALYL